MPSPHEPPALESPSLGQSLRYTLPRPARVRSGRNIGVLDRWLSALGGILLIPIIVYRSGLRRWSSLGLGFVLFGRAISGHSYLYGTLGCSSADLSPTLTSRDLESPPSSELPRMDFDIKRSITVARSKAEIYERLLDPGSWIEKLPGVGLAMPPSRLWVHADAHDKPEVIEFEIFDRAPDSEISWRCRDDSGRLRAVGALSLIDAPGNRGTEIALAFKTPGRRRFNGIGGLIELFIDREERMARKFLRSIKQILETGEVTTSEMRRT